VSVARRAAQRYITADWLRSIARELLRVKGFSANLRTLRTVVTDALAHGFVVREFARISDRANLGNRIPEQL
jgi:hypothetical protein